MIKHFWHNGRYIEAESAVFSPYDRMRLGDGAFDTMLVTDGLAQHGKRHITRLLGSLAVLALPCPYSADELLKIAQDFIARENALRGHYALNILVTRGVPSTRGLAIPQECTPNFTMMLSPVDLSKFPPVKAVICKAVRRNEHSPLSRIKSLNYGDNILALQEAKERGANEAIMMNSVGNLACASSSNIFLALDGMLYTPPLADGAMAGIMRGILLEQNLLQEKSLTPADLQHADALYLSNSMRGIFPVASLDGFAIAQQPIAHYIGEKEDVKINL